MSKKENNYNTIIRKSTDYAIYQYYSFILKSYIFLFYLFYYYYKFFVVATLVFLILTWLPLFFISTLAHFRVKILSIIYHAFLASSSKVLNTINKNY